MPLTKLAWWGGSAAILGGVLEIFAVAFVPRFGPPSLTMADPALYQATVLLSTVGSPLIALGLAGLYVRGLRQPGGSRLPKGLALAGLVLAGVASLLPLTIVLQLVVAGQIFVPPQSFFEIILPLELWGLPLATTLVGVAALWSGTMGRWRPLPLVVGSLMLFGMPYASLGLLWVLLGCVMLWTSREQSAAQAA